MRYISNVQYRRNTIVYQGNIDVVVKSLALFAEDSAIKHLSPSVTMILTHIENQYSDNVPCLSRFAVDMNQ